VKYEEIWKKKFTEGNMEEEVSNKKIFLIIMKV